MYTEQEIKGNITSIDRQLLLEIRNLLKEVVDVLKPQPTQIPIKDEIKATQGDKKQIKCKQCGQPFDNMGLMLAHCRKEHKKEGK